MGVDYRQQYKPQHLEPFFPHEIVKMIIVVLCTLAVLMFLVVLPTTFSALGLEGFYHTEEPADPTVTPPHIRPEWYFLAVYQFLKLMPADFVGIDGKALGIFIQSIGIFAMILLPFWCPLRQAKVDPKNWTGGLKAFIAMLGLITIPAVLTNFVRADLPEQYNGILHPMFVWPVFSLAAYLVAAALAQRFGCPDAYSWLNLYIQGLLLFGMQYLTFILVLGQGLTWTLESAFLSYLIGAIPGIIATVVIIRFFIQRARGQDEKSRIMMYYAFITEGIVLFLGLTIWAMWPAGEDGWHHEGKKFILTVTIMFLAVLILYVYLGTERRTVCQTLPPEERDTIT